MQSARQRSSGCLQYITSTTSHRWRRCSHGRVLFFTTQQQRRQCTLARAAKQQQQELAVPCPPQGYDYKAEILDETVHVVSQQVPQLMDLVEQGNLVAYRRPVSYRERRADGYREPDVIYVLGTAHVSQASAAEVARVVAAVQPQCVVVELCRSRVGALQLPEEQQQLEQMQVEQWQQLQQLQQLHPQQQEQMQLAPAAAAASTDSSSNQPEGYLQAAASAALQPSSSSSSSSSSKVSDWQLQRATNPMSLSGNSFVAALARSVQLGGQSGLLLRLLVAGQARAAGQLGVLPGAEFRAAARAADAAGASLVLGDRPIEITLERAWSALPWQRRFKLLGDLVMASFAPKAEPLTAADVERFRSDDSITGFFDELSSSYPELIAPLIAERDLYLAWSMKRSKAVNGTHAVVGVVGKGHLRGLVHALKHDQGNLRFADLVGGKNRKKSQAEAAAALGKRLLVELLIGAGVYAAWVAAMQPGGLGSLLPH